MQNSQPGFRIPWRKLLPVALSTLIFSDVLAKLYYATVVREKEKGLADHLKNEYLTRAKTFISINQPDGLLYLVRDAAFDFAAACTDKQTEKVGIVGEIFLKFNPYAQKHVTEWLISRGLEVVPPLITEFFTQSFVNRRTKKEDKLQRDHMPQWILRWFYHKVSGRIAQFNKAASAFPYYTPMGDIMAKARKASGIINLGAQFGEGWLISGEMATFAEEGINHVVSLQPFGCIANHIVEKGIEKKIKTLYPQMNILSLDFDSSVSNVNITNRLLLFIDNIGKQK
jgi:predicted nucleotide-binding protein (sugar kinase/HSP70/actin superfamily)